MCYLTMKYHTHTHIEREIIDDVGIMRQMFKKFQHY